MHATAHAQGREMSVRRRGLSGREAERLLRDAASGSPTDPDPLVRLLATAAAPAPERESASEEAALSAFRTARRAPSAPAKNSTVRSGLVKLFTAKVAVAVFAST